MSSYDGSRSARQSKRYSMSALYLSIANEADLEIEDDLAKGLSPLLPEMPLLLGIIKPASGVPLCEA